MTILKFLQNLLLLACLLSFARFMQMGLNYSYFVGPQDLLINAFVGFRFDLLILSFLLMPLLVFFLFNIRRKAFFVKGLDFVILWCWLFISAVYFLNFIFLNSHQDLIWNQDWVRVFSVLMSRTFLEIGGAFLMALTLFLIGVQFFKNIRRTLLSSTFRSRIIMFFILAFFARGSLGRDHLRRNDCDGRANSVVRALCLNPVYVFLKVKNQEFGP